MTQHTRRGQVRCTLVCSGATQILELLDLLLQCGLRPCRIKNKFAMASSELVGGYRDLMICLLFEHPERRVLPVPHVNRSASESVQPNLCRVLIIFVQH